MGWLSDILAKSDIIARDETVKTDAEPMWEQQTGSERRMVHNPLSDTSWLKDSREPTQAAIDHEKARMNEERDQRWAAQDRKAMDIPEPSTGAPWRQTQEAAHDPEPDPPARGISPA